MTGLGALNWISHALCGIGLAAPCMTVTPRLGEHSEIGRWLGLLDEPKTYSILTGIGSLLDGDGVVIGCVLLVFSVLFPIAKLAAIRHSLDALRRGRPVRAGWLNALGKYSMVDVFVIALMVVVSKSFPGGTDVDISWGVYPFALAALLTVLVSLRVRALAHASDGR